MIYHLLDLGYDMHPKEKNLQVSYPFLGWQICCKIRPLANRALLTSVTCKSPILWKDNRLTFGYSCSYIKLTLSIQCRNDAVNSMSKCFFEKPIQFNNFILELDWIERRWNYCHVNSFREFSDYFSFFNQFSF